MTGLGEEVVTLFNCTGRDVHVDVEPRTGSGPAAVGPDVEPGSPRVRSAMLATRPLRPDAYQDDAVFTHMLAHPRLRFLLADEPGPGKTVMTGMYGAGGSRQGLIPGKTGLIATEPRGQLPRLRCQRNVSESQKRNRSL